MTCPKRNEWTIRVNVKSNFKLNQNTHLFVEFIELMFGVVFDEMLLSNSSWASSWFIEAMTTADIADMLTS
jgi:hypothetical protein